MNKHDDFLVEILTEELPPKSLLKLAENFRQQIQERLQKANLVFEATEYFATPRRLAVFIKKLAPTQPAQDVERKGPALTSAYDVEGKPTPACLGFARSCGVTPEQLQVFKTEQGEWVGYKQQVPGKSVAELMPAFVEQALAALPVAKRMRWGSGEAQFVRPVHALLMLYGDQVIDATILGCKSGRVTRGHRFLAPGWITIPNAAAYATLLKTEGYVIADANERRHKIKAAATQCAQQISHAEVLLDEALLDEVTGLVEWPVALCGHFDEKFLAVPREALISCMTDHQRYFAVCKQGGFELLPYFITMSNLQTQDQQQIVTGNERVLRARLADAAFFFDTDRKQTLFSRLESLKDIVFQAKLGSLYDKSQRISQLAAFLAEELNQDVALAERAGWLCKTDLTTQMVGEFPELQGIMGYYYALYDHENQAVANAMKEHYMPRFAGDTLPATSIGQIVALADRLDTLLGAFGINQIPTGDKDPYGLRRAAVGVLRILIENNLNLDLEKTLNFALSHYTVTFENKAAVTELLAFIQERLKAWYLEQGLAPDVFAAVAALSLSNPLDMHHRVKAVQVFKKMAAAETLSIANKRVSNILAKYEQQIEAEKINPAIFENVAEEELARQLEAKSKVISHLSAAGNYEDVLLQLTELRQPIDDFFEHVMVMTDNKPQRENRLLLLSKLRALFLKVADIALLQ